MDFSSTNGNKEGGKSNGSGKKSKGKATTTPLVEHMKAPYSFRKEHTKNLFKLYIGEELKVLQEPRKPVEVGKLNG